MSVVYTPQILSGSVNGLPIDIDSSASPGILIHTATELAIERDEVYLYASSNLASLSLEPGYASFVLARGGLAAKDLLYCTIRAGVGDVPVMTGLRFTDGVEIRAWMLSGSNLSITGVVNNIRLPV